MNPEAIIFDLDGVIIDSEPLHEQAILRVCSEHGVPMTAAMLGPFKGKTDIDVFQHILDVYTPVSATLDTLLEGKRAQYTALLPQLTPIAGSLACLQTLHEGPYRLALVTSATPQNQQAAFARFNLAPFFEAVTTAADVMYPKPHPEPYQITVRRLGLPPAVTLVIEDSVHGVTSGKGAGCSVAAITSSFDADTLAAAGVDFIFDRYDQLLAWIMERA